MEAIFLIFFSSIYIPIIFMIFKKIFTYIDQTKLKENSFFKNNKIYKAELNDLISNFNNDICKDVREINYIRNKFILMYQEHPSAFNFFFFCGQCDKKFCAYDFIEFLEINPGIKLKFIFENSKWILNFKENLKNQEFHTFLINKVHFSTPKKNDIKIEFNHNIKEVFWKWQVEKQLFYIHLIWIWIWIIFFCFSALFYDTLINFENFIQSFKTNSYKNIITIIILVLRFISIVFVIGIILTGLLLFFSLEGKVKYSRLKIYYTEKVINDLSSKIFELIFCSFPYLIWLIFQKERINRIKTDRSFSKCHDLKFRFKNEKNLQKKEVFKLKLEKFDDKLIVFLNDYQNKYITEE